MHEGPGYQEQPSSRRVPGAAATTIRVPAFLNSLPRWLLRTTCSLQAFLRSILMMPWRSICPTSKSGATWPMPLPYPEVFSLRGSMDARSHVKRLTSLQVAVFDWLHLSKPASAPAELALGAPLSARQWSVVRMLEHLAFDGTTPELVDATAMGRAASKVEGFEESLAALSRAVSTLQSSEGRYYGDAGRCRSFPADDGAVLRCGQVKGTLPRVDEATAKPLIAERLQFPPGPFFDPRPFFDSSTLDLYEYPLTYALSLEDAPKPPQVQVRASPQERIRLYKKLAASGLLKPVPEGSYFNDYRNGLFAVPKDAVKDRMVLDGRPANLVGRSQNKWVQTMASAAALGQLHIEDDKVLICGGEDLRDYFYQFAVNKERTSRNVLQGSLTIEEAREVFGDSFSWPHSRVAVGLSNLAMGDLSAVEFAQCGHLGLLLQGGAVRVSELLTLHGSIPRGLLQIGIIVDDLVILQQVLRSALDEFGVDVAAELSAKRLALARKAYHEAHLLNNEKKGFAGETCTNFWGIDIDGNKGLLRASQRRLWPCMVITLRVCALGLATVGLLESLAGMWVSLLSVRRRLFSAMDIIFEPLTLDCSSSTVVRLSAELTAELTAIAVLGTLAVVNLRADFAPFVSATDSSGSTIAAVRACEPRLVAKEAARHCVRKGVWTKLLQPGKALLRMHGLLDPDDEMPEEGYRTHPLWEILARGLRYHETWRRRIRRPKHINVTELQAFAEEEKRIANSTPSLRVLTGLDSQVSLGTVAKGRAASKSLNNVMQQNMCYAIGGDVYSLPMYFNTASNRADGPTRGTVPAPPDLALPFWFGELATGDCSGFDAWLREVGAPHPDPLLPYDDICGGQELDLRSAATVKIQEKMHARNAAPAREAAPDGVRQTCDSAPMPESEVPVSSALSADAVALLNSFPRKQFFFKEGVFDFFEPGCLDLFSGKFGVAKQLVRCGAPWVLTFEWERSAAEDLLQPELRQKLRQMMREGCFKSMGAAPICASFSVAVTPPVRSSQYPRGLPNLRRSMQQKVKDGNSHSDFVCDLVDDAEDCDLGYFVENPDTSWWWRQRRWKRWRSSNSKHVFRLCFCRFGTPWRKATRIATNTRLAGVRMMCTCKRPHQRLRGGHPTLRKPWTAVAQPYPRGLCRLLALSLCQHAGWCGRERLNVAECAKLGCLRPGEAKNPGPRRRDYRGREGTLSSVTLVTAQTLALEARQLALFCAWCRRWLGEADLDSFFSAAPQFLVAALEAYAEWLYKNAGALSNLRHLILAAQRWIPSSRPLMMPAWEMVDRWEMLVPVNHRIPIPLNVVCAMCTVAWHFGWYSWVAATVLAFFGAGRLGEVLKCCREDLVLPQDVFEEPGSPVFLRLRSFKSQFRQPAKVQHMKVVDRAASLLLAKVFRSLPLDAPLFASTPYQYRKRWDLVLRMLSIPSRFQLTPGGLRGGAAVYHYKCGKPINDLMWLLRLRSQTTLESYLQEVAALNLFARLPSEARDCIKTAAALFAFLPAGKLGCGYSCWMFYVFVALLIFGPPAVGKSTISTEVAKSLFDNPGKVVIVDGNDVRDAHEGFSKVAQHGLMHNLLHTDAWDILKETKHVENLKKEIMNLAVQNRQDVIIPECALKPERVHQMLKQMEHADYEIHAICLWAPLDSVQHRGSQRSLKAGKAFTPKFHTPSCAGSLEFGRHFDLKIREGCRHYCSLICYDNTVKPSHPVHLVEFEHLIKMGPEETKEHIRNCMLARAAYMIEHGGSRASSDIASTPLLVSPTSDTSDRLPPSGRLGSMLQAAVRRGRRQGLLCGLFLALVVFAPLLYWI
eukprot:s1798_g15.t1